MLLCASRILYTQVRRWRGSGGGEGHCGTWSHCGTFLWRFLWVYHCQTDLGIIHWIRFDPPPPRMQMSLITQIHSISWLRGHLANLGSSEVTCHVYRSITSSYQVRLQCYKNRNKRKVVYEDNGTQVYQCLKQMINIVNRDIVATAVVTSV